MQVLFEDEKASNKQVCICVCEGKGLGDGAGVLGIRLRMCQMEEV